MVLIKCMFKNYYIQFDDGKFPIGNGVFQYLLRQQWGFFTMKFVQNYIVHGGQRFKINFPMLIMFLMNE